MTKNEFLYREQAYRVIGVRVELIRAMEGDVLTGMLLSQIIYWHTPAHDGSSKLKVQQEGQLWLAKSYKEWHEEIQFSKKQTHRCLMLLESMGIIKLRIFKFNNAPTMHIQIVWDVLLPLLEKLEKSDSSQRELSESGQRELSAETPENSDSNQRELSEGAIVTKGNYHRVPKAPIKSDQRALSYVTEITSENTTESTLSGEPDDSLAQDVSEIPLSGEDEAPQISGSPDDSPGSAPPGRLFSGKKKTIQEAPDAYYLTAQDFYARLLAKNKIMRPPNLKQWAATLKDFTDSGNITREEFREIRLWYCEHIGEEFVPEAYSMEGFCEKFVQIKQARQRTMPRNSGPSPARLAMRKHLMELGYE